MLPTFDGHANCFIESGFGKGLLIDFNYDVEPLPGRYPLPGVGRSPCARIRDEPLGQNDVPLDVWNILLKGQELPLPARMTMAGKCTSKEGMMEQSLVELNQKLDALTAQVAYLTDQAQMAERQRQERAELMRDLTRSPTRPLN